MLDLAKIADLVLLLIDASYGFELETFEFINILQVPGGPSLLAENKEKRAKARLPEGGADPVSSLEWA